MHNKVYRMTKQCSLILDLLNKQKEHPTAEELFTRVRGYDKKISLGTIYRNLEKLKNQGKVIKFNTGENKYRWDGTIKEHFHIRCKKCFEISDLFDTSIQNLENEVINETGFNKLNINLEITGICPKCEERGK